MIKAVAHKTTSLSSQTVFDEIDQVLIQIDLAFLNAQVLMSIWF
jgi:hypothetical protein